MDIAELTKRADEVRPQAKSVMAPHIAHTQPAHLEVLYRDLKGDEVHRRKASDYVAQMFLRIMALTQPNKNFGAVMLVTSEICDSEPFRNMLGDVAAEIIEEIMPDVKEKQ